MPTTPGPTEHAPIGRKDELVVQPPEKLDPQLVKELSRLRPWIPIAYIAREWLFILAPIIICIHYWHPLLYVAVVVWIGSRQHALGVLLHEATHYRVTKNRFLNELIGHVFLAFPTLASMSGFRATHFAHHRAPNTDDDPDWTYRLNDEWHFPKSRLALAWLLIRDAIGLNTLEYPKLGRRYADAVGQSAWIKLARICSYLVVFAIFWHFRLLWAVGMYWFVPYLTAHKVILRIRSISEHHGGPEIGGHPYRETRTTIPSWWERILISPLNVNYHLDHHLYPSVPFYNLPKLHRALQKCDKFRDTAYITQTYCGVLRECRGIRSGA
ncbi:MAG: fatty acid desaturase family protein [Planctomycetota bacterium]|nr:fatty acid desaturase family protein [Planctomycetota bacterium]